MPGGLSETVTLVYAYATYMLFYLSYSLVNIPFGSLASAMTQLPDERAKLSSARSIGAALAIIGLTAVVSPQLSSSSDLQRSLTVTTLIFAAVGVGLYAFLFATSRETVARDAAPVSLRQSVDAIRRNRPLLLLCLSALVVLTGLFIMQTLQIYYARDVLGSANYTILLTLLTTGAMFVVSPVIPKIVETVGKKRAYLVAGIVSVAGGVGIALTVPTVPVLPFVFFAVYGIGIAALQALMWALQADTVEYGEWESGVRTEGSNYAALSFTRKVGQGIGGAVAAYGIGLGGYVAGSARQTPGALDTIRYLTGGASALFVGVGTVIMFAYPLTEERFRTMIAETAARRSGRGRTS